MTQIGYTSRAESISQFLTVILVFLLILVLTYFTTRFVGKFQGNYFGQVNRNFEAIETYRITGGKFLQLIRVGNKYVVISVSKDNISTICELSEEEIVKLSDERKDNSESFKSLLENTKKRIGKGGNQNDK